MSYKMLKSHSLFLLFGLYSLMGAGLLVASLWSVVTEGAYQKAQRHFQERKRPLPHFLDIGAGTSVLNLYPFKASTFPLMLHFNYRREKWQGLKKRLPVIFSLGYEAHRKKSQRIYALTGIRHPKSHDLSTFYVDFLVGGSFSLSSPFKFRIPLEIQIWCTRILGPSHLRGRLYFQWGLKARYHKRLESQAALRMGIDYHL